MIYLEVFFILFIMLIHIKQRNWPTTLYLIFIFVCFSFTIVRFPLQVHLSEESEIYWAYVQRGPGQIVASLKNTEMPMYYIFLYGMQDVFFLHPAAAVIILRFMLCLAIFASYLLFSKSIFKKYNVKTNSVNFFVPTFFCLFDWNINYLALGDEFRNALALVFLILQMTFLEKREYKSSLLCTILAIFSHKLGIVFSFVTLIIYILIKKYKERMSAIFCATIIPVSTIVFIKAMRMIAFRMKNDFILNQLNHNIVVGIKNGLMKAPGMILAEIIYGSLLFVCFKNFENIKKDILLLVALTLSVIIFTASNYGIITGERFQEPNRFYFMLAIYLPIVAGVSLVNWNKKILLIYMGGFYIANFLFKQFARDVISYRMAHQGRPLEDLIMYFIKTNSFIGAFVCLTLIGVVLSLFRKKMFTYY